MGGYSPLPPNHRPRKPVTDQEKDHGQRRPVMGQEHSVRQPPRASPEAPDSEQHRRRQRRRSRPTCRPDSLSSRAARFCFNRPALNAAMTFNRSRSFALIRSSILSGSTTAPERGHFYFAQRGHYHVAATSAASVLDDTGFRRYSSAHLAARVPVRGDPWRPFYRKSPEPRTARTSSGGVAEWSMAAVLKTAVLARAPGVRILSPPPTYCAGRRRQMRSPVGTAWAWALRFDVPSYLWPK